MDIPVTSRIHRILVDMKPYKNFKDCDKNPDDYPIVLDEGEIPLGIYENVPGQIEESIIVTDQAIYYCDKDDHSEKARYKDIIEAIMPQDKLNDDVLKVKMEDGQYFLLPIRRAYPGARTSDLFEFIRFLDNVRYDTIARVIHYMSVETLKEEVDKLINNPSLYSNDYINEIILAISRKEVDFDLAVKICRAFIEDPSRRKVRAVAIKSVIHIAHAYQKLVPDDILNKLEEIYQDKEHDYWREVNEVYEELRTIFKDFKP